MENIDRSRLLRHMFKEGLVRHRLELAIERYAEGDLTVCEAGNLAGVAVGRFMDTLVERGGQADFTAGELADSLDHARNELSNR